MDDVAQLSAALADRYSIEREIGRGGMATVYLARDIKHARNVALKVLSAELGAILGVERFLGEIRVTANLQHPNLLPLFDSGEADGLLFYVMPFVEGETLRHRIDREKQLPVDEAVRIAVAVAGALDYAHRHGVIHRDLKPENILLHDGQPLVADFGIALAVSNAGGQRVTQTGLSLGTPQYMSPEQATGDRGIDARSDIYSLAALTYEMLAGEPPHSGTTAQAIIARLLTEEPRPLSAVRRSVPPQIESAVRRGLEKLPADRIQSARDFADALAGRHTESRELSVHRRASGSFASRQLAGAALGAGLLIGGAAVYAWRRAHELAPRVERFTIEPPAGMTINDVAPFHTFALSPDGQTIAFAAGPRMALYLRRLDQLEATPVGKIEGVSDGAFSPDGQSLALALPNGVFGKVGLGTNQASASASAVADSVFAQGVDWSFGGDVLTWGGSTGLLAISPSGKKRVVLSRDTIIGNRINPVLLADGGPIVYSQVPPGSIAGGNADSLQLVSLDGRSITPLGIQGHNAIGVLDGVLVYGASAGRVMGVRFDLRTRKVLGEPVMLVDGVSTRVVVRAALSRNGTLAYLTTSSSRVIQIVERDGGIVNTLSAEPREWGSVSASPDGKRLALQSFGLTGRGELWVYDMASRVTTKLQDNVLQSVRWTPDGGRLAFMRNEPTGFAPYWMPANGGGPAERIPNTAGVRFWSNFNFSPDGKNLIAPGRVGQATTARDVFAVPLDGKSPPLRLFQTDRIFGAPVASPDGKWLAYTTAERGSPEVYVRPFAANGSAVQISAGGGQSAQWTADGRRLIYIHNGSFWTTTLDVAGAVPRVVRTDSLRPQVYRNYDHLPDGRLAVISDDGRGPKLVVVTNWWQEVKTKFGIPR